MARSIVVRAGIPALFIEGAFWSAIRLFSFIYVLAQEADLGSIHQTPGWVRLKFVAISVGLATVLFTAGGALRNGAGPAGRIAQILAVVVNAVVLVQGITSLAHPSGAEAVVTAAGAVLLAAACLAGLALDLRAAAVGRGPWASAGVV